MMLLRRQIHLGLLYIREAPRALKLLLALNTHHGVFVLTIHFGFDYSSSRVK